MISHAFQIVINELNKHLKDAYPVNPPASPLTIQLGNMAEGFSSNVNTAAVGRDLLILSLVNIREEKSLKNLPNYVRNDVTLRAEYENPPVFLNFLILITSTHKDYSNAMLSLSRVLRFFQFKNVLTEDTVLPTSISDNKPVKEIDQLESFKLIFELYSPTLEEVNHLWGTLGGKQYPFVLYTLRMLDLKFKAVQRESGLITEVTSDFYHKNTAGN